MPAALDASVYPLIVWGPAPKAAVELANQAAADLTGVPVERLIGLDVRQVIGPTDEVSATIGVLDSGVADGVKTRRFVLRPDGDSVPVCVWTRRFELAGRRSSISILLSAEQQPRLGRDPERPWRDSAPIAVGTIDAGWHIRSLSADIGRILGGTPEDWVGRSVLDLVDPDDVARLVQVGEAPMLPRSRSKVCFRHRDGGWVAVCIIVAPLVGGPSSEVTFALVGPSASEPFEIGDRAGDLEMTLRRIGLEVQAAGLLDTVQGLPAASDFSQIGELSSRQWEILSRLLRGERVPTIADALYLSRSTVRNHLAAIFRKFGVHSQAELIQMLRRPAEAFVER